jgi:hypothetical protein
MAVDKQQSVMMNTKHSFNNPERRFRSIRVGAYCNTPLPCNSPSTDFWGNGVTEKLNNFVYPSQQGGFSPLQTIQFATNQVNQINQVNQTNQGVKA